MPNRGLGPVVLVTVAVVLAGCAGVGDFVGGESERDTVTPVPVPEAEPATPTETGPTSPSDRFDDQALSQLRLSYKQRLYDTSYEVRFRQRLVVGGEVQRVSTLNRSVADDGRTHFGRFRRSRANASDVRFHRFYNGSVLATRYVTADDLSYSFISEPTYNPSDLAAWSVIESTLRGFVIDSVRRTQDGPLVLRGTRIDSPEDLVGPRFATSVDNGTLTARFYENGSVDLVASYDTRIAGGRQGRVTREITISQVGNTTVETPSWLAAAAGAS